MSRNEFLINLLLLGGIIALGWQILTIEPNVHIEGYNEKTVAKLEERMESREGIEAAPLIDENETQYTAETLSQTDVGRDFPFFAKQMQFDSLIPPPTPKPRPTPTPTPPANLSQAMQLWEFFYSFEGQASFKDKTSNEDFNLRVGETRTVSYDRYEIDVTLAAVDEENFTATVRFEGQEFIFSPFGQ